MKIGAFAKKNEISIDTVRHYINMGLVLPIKEDGSQYHFDHRCQEQVEEILNLKAMGFQLKEIKNIFMYKLLSNMTGYQKDAYYRMLFEDKYKLITQEIDQLGLAKDKLVSELKVLESHKDDKHHTIGLPLSAIDMLACPACQSKLRIKSGEIVDNQIVKGILGCKCNLSYSVDDGILMIDSGAEDDAFNYTENYASVYFKGTDTDYLENIYKRIDWSKRTLDYKALNQKTILDLGSGVGFAMRNLYNQLPDDCHYIAVDHNLKRHQFLKSIMEKAEEKKNVVFICADFGKIPLREKSIDLILDFTGTSNYSLTNSDFLMDGTIRYLKDEGFYLGIFILFRKFAKGSRVEPNYRDNFSLQYVKRKLIDLGFATLRDNESDLLYHGGEYENFFIEGEEVFTYQFYGQKKQ